MVFPPSQQKARDREAQAAAQRRAALLSGSTVPTREEIEGNDLLSVSGGHSHAPGNVATLGRAVSQVFGEDVFALLSKPKEEEEKRPLSANASVPAFHPSLQRSKSLSSLMDSKQRGFEKKPQSKQETSEEKDSIPEPRFVVLGRQASRRAFQGFRVRSMKAEEKDIPDLMEEQLDGMFGQVETWVEILQEEEASEELGGPTSPNFSVIEIQPEHMPASYWKRKKVDVFGGEQGEETMRSTAPPIPKKEAKTPLRVSGLGCGWKLPSLESTPQQPPFVVESFRPSTVSPEELKARREQQQRARKLYTDAWAMQSPQKKTTIERRRPTTADVVHNELEGCHSSKKFKAYIMASNERVPHFLQQVELDEASQQEQWMGGSLEDDKERARAKREAWKKQLEASSMLASSHRSSRALLVPSLHMPVYRPTSRSSSRRSTSRGQQRRAIRGLQDLPSARPAWNAAGGLESHRSGLGTSRSRGKMNLDFSAYV